MIYFIDFQKTSYINGRRFNADGKPKTDVKRSLLNREGVKVIILNNYGGNSKLSRYISNLIILLKIYAYFISIRKAIVLIQYPYMIGCIKPILSYLRKKQNRIAVLVHDIESLRTGATASSEKLLLNSDIIIVHSTEMANKLKEKGFKGKTVPLEFFDYYSNIKNNTNVSKTTKNILFAGNLEKSTFLYKLNNAITDPQITYLLYGEKNSDLPLSKQIIYKGMFDAEQFSLVEGNWGLVWDGDSIDTCAGPYGKYLQINAPFKLSLYLAMNIPVIVWNKSAMAKYVKKYHLGICVDNLKEISTKIDALSENDLAQIYIGVSKASLDVKQGEKIKSVIQKLENI